MNVRHPLALTAWLTLAGATSASAQTNDADPPDNAFCTATATQLLTACYYEGLDDYHVTMAKCVNLRDMVERQECKADAKTERAESRQTCREQRNARLTSCKVLGEGRYQPEWDPSRFDSDFRALSNPNPYFPLGIGYRWEFAGEDETSVIEVLNETKLIDGVRCIVSRDLVYEEGRLKEATDDWFAAARDGTAWYCGEESKDFETFAGDHPRRAELVSIEGSFKQGRELDRGGIIMPAVPRPGVTYREEFSLGNAEDVAVVLSNTYAYGKGGLLDQHVPRELAQRFCGQGDCVVTRNHSLLEPGVFELKYYAKGVGLFLETSPGEGVELQLTNCNFDARCASLPRP